MKLNTGMYIHQKQCFSIRLLFYNNNIKNNILGAGKSVFMFLRWKRWISLPSKGFNGVNFVYLRCKQCFSNQSGLAAGNKQL
jgi:hypothetical protein